MGYDWASVGDHLMQIPAFGARETDPWLEAWTQLAALAQATSRIRIGTLVSSVGYRHPGMLAKMAATVDVISGGRLEFGSGAGYAEAEYRMYGLPFPDTPGYVNGPSNAIPLPRQERSTQTSSQSEISW